MKQDIDPREYGALIENVKDIKSDMTEARIELARIKTILEDKYATKEWVDTQYGGTKTTMIWIGRAIGAIIIGALMTLILRK